MPATSGLNHLAMSVPTGTLTPEWRAAFFAVYGRVFGWTEIENGTRSDRMTVATGGSCYLNVREREQPMTCTDYEHFGVVVESADEVEQFWARLVGSAADIELEDVHYRAGGVVSFKVRHMLPMTMEIQFLPPGAADASPRPWRRKEVAEKR